METTTNPHENSLIFMLPRLLESGLLPYDGNDYALVTYPFEIISKSAMLIVGDYGTRLDSINMGNKKRVKLIIENLAVTFSLSVDNYEYMSIARVLFRKFFEDTSIFGDVKRQNKFLRRLLKIISIPFQMKEAKNFAAQFKSSFYSILIDILDDLKYVHTKKGYFFEKETWILIIKVLIGIVDELVDFDFGEILPIVDASKLRQKAVSTCFSTVIKSGIDDKDVWSILNEYFKKWTKCLDYIKVWGKHIETLFMILNMKIFNQEIEDLSLFSEGVYSDENPISYEMIKFIFIHFLNFIEPNNVILNPENYREFAQILSKITMNSIDLGYCQNSFFVTKYPSNGFLKLFGKYLTFAPILDEKFDEAVSIMIETILTIISNFQIDHNGEILLRLVSYISRRATHIHMPIVASYLKNAIQLFRHDSIVLPFISELALNLFPQLDTTKSARMIIGEKFLISLTSLFISSAEFLKSNIEFTSKIIDSFETIWSTTGILPIRYQLICNSYGLNISITSKLSQILSETYLNQLLLDSSNIPFLSATIMFIGVYIRFNPSISEHFCENNVISTILNTIINLKGDNLEEYELLILSVLQMLLNCITYGCSLFISKESISVLLRFIEFIENLIQKANKASQQSLTYFGKYLSLIVSLKEQIVSTIPFVIPNNDFFTRKLNSCDNVNEEYIIWKFNIVEPIVSYFKIGEYSIASFIESKDGKLMILFIRNLAGRNAFLIHDDYIGELNEAVLSDEIEVTSLPKLGQVNPQIPDDQNFSSESVYELPLDTYYQFDRKLINKYIVDCEKVLDWNKYGRYLSSKSTQEYLRPRAIDFLSTLNLVPSIQMLNAPNGILRELDELDRYQIIPIVINHILPQDKSALSETGFIDYINGVTSQRMSTFLSQFLDKIAEPLMIQSTSLPKLKTSVPVIPTINSFGAFLVPSMASDEEGAMLIYEMSNDCPIRIIFNETDFDLKISDEKKPKQIILVIRPLRNGIYHVTQVQVPRKIYSPFAYEQALTPESIAFNISIYLEQIIRDEYWSEKIFSNIQSKKDIFEMRTSNENEINQYADIFSILR